MNTYDFSPLLRTAIGFDRLARLVSAPEFTTPPSYPPYNIEKTGEDTYRLTLAVAGFRPEDIEMTAENGKLTIVGKGVSGEGATDRFLHRGIAARAFERRFELADHLVVEGASLEHGLLHVDLRRVIPDALKPRRIEIAGSAPQTIEGPQA
jgi:molecular chaperone IbpA